MSKYKNFINRTEDSSTTIVLSNIDIFTSMQLLSLFEYIKLETLQTYTSERKIVFNIRAYVLLGRMLTKLCAIAAVDKRVVALDKISQFENGGTAIYISMRASFIEDIELTEDDGENIDYGF